MKKNFIRTRRLRTSPIVRDLVRETEVTLNDFIYPMFVVDKKNFKEEVASMSGVFQMSINHILEECEKIIKLGIKSILLFGIPSFKDCKGSSALSHESIIARSAREIKANFKELYVIADVCFCEYTDHGHCGILENNNVANDETLKILAEQSVILAQNGIDMIAPSSMMDGQIAKIRQALDSNNLEYIPIMSYSTKFASNFYSPFRDAALSTPNFGDRKSYQEDYANRFEAIRESLIDEDEGADILMIKPALAYLDIVRDLRERTLLPIAAYNVSGEYALLKAGAKLGLIDYESTLMEIMTGFKRAGANLIISYHAKDVAKILKK